MFLNQKNLYYYYIIIAICLSAVLFSNPFLRYPYDMIHHLIVIDEIYMTLTTYIEKLVGIWANDIYIMVPTGEYEEVASPKGRHIWHYAWASVFNVFGVDSTQMLLRAKVIHVVQIYITLFSIYFFSKVVIRNVFKPIDILTLKWLSLWSVIIWVSIFATYSGTYHQVWMMWYSVNYQITLPLFWYMTALTLVLFLEDVSWNKKLFFMLQILLISRFILQAHSMEFMYYLMYMLVFALVFIDKVYYLTKRYFYLFIPLMVAIGYFMKNYQPDKSKIFNYLSFEKIPLLYDKIMQEGDVLLSGYNRASGSINELMMIIGVLGVSFLGYLLWAKIKGKKVLIDSRMVVFLSLTSLFVVIPLYQFSGGLFGIITNTMVVNRLYYSASLFVLLPIMVYHLSTRYQRKLWVTNVVLFTILSGTYVYSKHIDTVNNNYYKNIQSIKNSFTQRKVGFNLDSKQIVWVGKQIKQHEKNNTKQRKIRYYARADMAFVIKYLYHKDVYWEGRRANPDYRKIYEQNKDNEDYLHILFEVPKDFPSYRPFT